MNKNRPRIQLYQLYHDDGSPNDLGESHNLAESQAKKRDELLDELNAWLAKYDAALPYKNAHTPDRSLPDNDQVPEVVRRSSDGDRLAVEVETGPGKAKIIDARLVYTTNGSDFLRDHKGYEEWLEAPATVEGGIARATAPPGMTHGVFYLRDEHGFLVNSEWVPPDAGPGGKPGTGTDLIEDGYAWRPGLVSLIQTGLAAGKNAQAAQLDTAALDAALQAARAVAAQPVKEKPYALAIRNLRREIRSLAVPEARLPVLNQFRTAKW